MFASASSTFQAAFASTQSLVFGKFSSGLEPYTRPYSWRGWCDLSLTSTSEGCQSGRMGQSRKLLRSFGPPWVRIPRLPPVRPRASMVICEHPAEWEKRGSKLMDARRRFRCVTLRATSTGVSRVTNEVRSHTESTARGASARRCGRRHRCSDARANRRVTAADAARSARSGPCGVSRAVADGRARRRPPKTSQ